MSQSERLVWVCLHLLVFLVPLVISNLTALGIGVPIPGATALVKVAPFTFDQFDIVKVFTMRAIVLIAFGAWAWGILTKGGRVRFTRVEWVVAAFLAWVTLTTVLSVHPPTAVFGKYRRFEGLLSFITYAAVFFLALQVVDRPSRARSLARTFSISGMLVALYGVGQYLGIDPWTWGNLPFETNRGFSTFGNPDMYGGFLVLPFGVTLGLALSERDERWRSAYWVFTLILVVAGLTSFTRGAWIGATVALIAFVWAYLVARRGSDMRLERVDQRFLGVTAVAAIAVIARSLANPDPVRNVVSRVVSIFQFDQGSALTRFQIWEAALAAIRERPFFGWGADTFRLLYPMFKREEYVASAGYLSVADNVHNYPLQLASALGVPGALLLYALFAYALYASARQVFVRGSGTDRLVFAGFWAAALGYIVHLIFGISVTGSTVFLWLCFGVLLSPGARAKVVQPPRIGPFVGAAIIVLVVVGSWMNIRYIVADNHYLRAKVVERDQLKALEHIDRAIELNPYNDMYLLDRGQIIANLFQNAAFTAAQQEATGADATATKESARVLLEQAEQAYTKTIEYVPEEYDTYVFFANLYNLAAVYVDPAYSKQAIEIGLRGVEVEEFGPAIRLQLCIAYMAANEPEKALEQIKRATEMDPNYTDAWTLLGDVYRRMGRYDEADAAYKYVLEKNPEHPEARSGLLSAATSRAAEATGAK
jgi:tetratricopeptide (TPR) repeat protein